MKREYFSFAIRNILHKKLRSWLTMLGIFISIATIFALVSISIGLNQSVEEQFQKLGTDKFFILPKGQLSAAAGGGAVQLNVADAEVVERVTGVKEVSYYAIATAEVSVSDRTRYVTALGLPVDKLDLWLDSGLNDFESGETFRKGDVRKITVGYQYSEDNFLKQAFEPGDKLEVQGQDFRIKGIFISRGNPQDDQQIIFSLDEFRELFPESGERIDGMIIRAEPGEDIREVASRVEKRLRSYRDVDEKTQDFTISTPEELLATFGLILNLLTGFLLGVGGISLVVGGIGIANTMYTSVVERTKDIGVMKSVGAKNSDIVAIFLTEAGIIGAIGGIIGVALGYIIAKSIEVVAIAQLGEGLFRAGVTWYLVLGLIAFSFLVGIMSGAFPAWRASKIRPIEALRYE